MDTEEELLGESSSSLLFMELSNVVIEEESRVMIDWCRRGDDVQPYKKGGHQDTKVKSNNRDPGDIIIIIIIILYIKRSSEALLAIVGGYGRFGID